MEATANCKDSLYQSKLGTIKLGTMQTLYCVKICAPKNVKRYTKILEASDLAITEYNNNHSIKLKDSFCEWVLKKRFDNDDKRIDVPPVLNITFNGEALITTVEEPAILQAQKDLDNMVNSMNMNLRYAAHSGIEQRYILLQPILLETAIGKRYTCPIALLLPSGLAIIRVEQELHDVTVADFSNSNFEDTVLSVDFPYSKNGQSYKISTPEQQSSTEMIRSMVLQSFINEVNCPHIKCYNTYQVLALYDYDFAINDYQLANDNFYRNISYLMHAPMNLYNEFSIEMAKTEVARGHYEINRHAHVFVSASSRVIIADIGNSVELLKEELKEETEDTLYQLWLRGLLESTTPCVETVLLKKTITQEIVEKCTVVNGKSLSALMDTKRHIHELSIYELQNYYTKYGTMTKLTDFIDSSNTTNYTEIQANEFISSFNDTVATKSQLKHERISNIFTVLGFLLSLILSYVGIRDIVSTINYKIHIFDVSNNVALFEITTCCWAILSILVMLIFVIVWAINRFKTK